MDKEDITCSICLEEPHYISNIDPCKHQFCFDCITRWSKVANTCPLCQVRFAKITKTFVSQGKKRKRDQDVDIHYTETRRGVRDVLIARIHQYFYNMRMMAPIRLDDISHISNFVDTLQSDTNETSNEQDTVNEEIPQEPNRKIIKLRSRTIVTEL